MPTFQTPRAYYGAHVSEFLAASRDSVLGALAARSVFAVEPPQRDAWTEEIEVLKTALMDVDGVLFLEFDVPRVGSRIDTVLLSGPTLFVIEFKVGEDSVHQADYEQVWDYALDLKNFHKASPQPADRADSRCDRRASPETAALAAGRRPGLSTDGLRIRRPGRGD